MVSEANLWAPQCADVYIDFLIKEMNRKVNPTSSIRHSQFSLPRACRRPRHIFLDEEASQNQASEVSNFIQMRFLYVVTYNKTKPLWNQHEFKMLNVLWHVLSEIHWSTHRILSVYLGGS